MVRGEQGGHRVRLIGGRGQAERQGSRVQVPGSRVQGPGEGQENLTTTRLLLGPASTFRASSSSNVQAAEAISP